MIIQQPAPVPTQSLPTGQDKLIAAGSNVSFRDVYDRQMDIPLIRRKFYPAKDVDHIFVLMNGILANISQSHYQVNQSLLELREENAKLNETLEQNENQLSQMSESNIQLANSNRDMSNLIQALKEQIGAQAVLLNERNNQLEQLKRERMVMASHIKKMENNLM